jgi:tRNA-dihydrouridine synthase A
MIIDNPWQKPQPISLAPMMDYTDRHFRYLLRLISKEIVLYTEMITAKAIIHGDFKKFLDYSAEEHPLVCQLGGSNPEELALASKQVQLWGYDEINLNVGCPSPRVVSGSFGACLMKEPQLVADCVQAMQDAVQIPVTVKTRLGVDEYEDYDFLRTFTDAVAKAGVKHLILHARKAWLSGLSPKENREVPPLMYDRVYQLKKDYPDLMITLNGGVQDLPSAQEHLRHVDSVMLGRALCQHPMLLAPLDHCIAKAHGRPDIAIKSADQIILEYLRYMQTQIDAGWRITTLIKPIIGLYYGLPGGKQWRRFLSTEVVRASDPVKMIQDYDHA